MISRNIDMLDSLMDDDLILHHISGATQAKWEWLNCIKNEQMRYFRIDIENPVIKIIDNQASISYTSIIDARIFGYRGTWTISGNSFFVKKNGKWIWTSFPDKKKL